MRFYLHHCLLLCSVLLFAQCTKLKPKEAKKFDWSAFVENNESELIKRVLAYSDSFEVQIRYTQIDRDENQVPTFTSYGLNLEPEVYFYPASTVKMPVAFLALQKINELKEQHPDITLNTTMVVDSIRPYQTAALTDTTAATGLPSVGHYIKKLFVVSDNDAYNRLYEFLGQDYINEQLKEKGVFTHSRIVSRVGVGQLSKSENATTNPLRFLRGTGEPLYQQAEQIATKSYMDEQIKMKKGRGYYDDDLDSVILEPFSFYGKNALSLTDLEASLKRVIFPDSFPEDERFNLNPEDYHFLYDAMAAYPKDYSFYVSDEEMNYDAYVKFFMFGDDKKPIPEHIHIYNKVGFAYGYLTDCAYIFDTENKIEFFLSATVHVNANQIYNDGKYEYDEIGIPFLAELGRQIYDLELSRHRAIEPKLLR